MVKGRRKRRSSCKTRSGGTFKGEATKHCQYRGRWEALDEADMDEGDAMHLGREDDEWEKSQSPLIQEKWTLWGPKGSGQGTQPSKLKRQIEGCSTERRTTRI